jgi:hypothetical protein
MPMACNSDASSPACEKTTLSTREKTDKIMEFVYHIRYKNYSTVHNMLTNIYPTAGQR